ncbi:MAG: hypothetical protein R2698_03520 [Microthrixaceae bacterium]
MATNGRADRNGRGYEDTLVSVLASDAVPFETLHERYHSLLELVRTLIGVVPNCDRYLEIWPPAFRTYNLMVPNLLNLPFSLFGRGPAPIEIVGLGMYAASRAAECPYCSAHTCSFALRRGADAASMIGAVAPEQGGNLGEPAATAAGVARAIAEVPSRLTAADRLRLERYYGPDGAESIVWGVVMMGFLNKFMDTIGVELEASTYAEVRATMGDDWDVGVAGWDLEPGLAATSAPPADSWPTRLRLAPLIPSALRLDRRWQRGMPTSWPEIGRCLEQVTGHRFPVLGRVRQQRPVRAVASMLRENLSPTTSVLGLRTKVLAGAVFAAEVDSEALVDDMSVLGTRWVVGADEIGDVQRWVRGDAQCPFTDETLVAVLELARAASPSPARVDRRVVDAWKDAGLGSGEAVELVCWLSVLQLLHRLSCWTAAV